MPADAKKDTGQLKGMTLNNDIRDVTGPLDFPVTLWPVILMILLVAGMALFAIVTGFIGYVKKRNEEIRKKTPYEIALERLEILKKKDFAGSGLYNELFTGLSLVVRHYIEGRFDIKAPEMTTEEFLASLKISEKLNVNQKKLLKDFLVLCDMVKFANYGPAEYEIGSAFDAALKFIEETKPEAGS